MTVYADYQKTRPGFLFGLTVGRLALLAATVLPIFVAINRADWPVAGGLTLAWLVLVVLVTVPVRGRSATGWLWAATTHTLARAAGWSRFTSLAARGQHPHPDLPDLPGVLSGLLVHDGPPHPTSQVRFAVIQHRTRRTWAVTCHVTHPGLALAADTERDSWAAGWAALLDACHHTGLIRDLHVITRTVPDPTPPADPPSPEAAPGVPELAATITAHLSRLIASVSVHTETFITLVVDEHRLAKPGRALGGGLPGRCLALYQLMGELEGLLRTQLGMTDVAWLTSPQLATTVRTGYAPSHPTDTDDPTPWALAGPATAINQASRYRHDAWESASSTFALPARGAVIGALAPVITPSEPAERRSLLVCYPLVTQTRADRTAQQAALLADTARSLRHRAGIRTRAKEQASEDQSYALDQQLATGHALIQPYAIATITTPSRTVDDTDPAGRLDQSIRRAGYHPQRLDLAHDTAFAASTLPLGINLTGPTP